ncbi:MAG: hypothetical protein ABIZ72_02010 [Candidatus Limnocylindrales bacterium]
MTTRGRTLAALLVVLGRPTWWILGLAGFLVRGGIVLFALAIVTLPSPLALSNVLGPLVTPLYLGRIEPSTIVLIGGGIALLALWLVVGAWIAAATEVVLVRDARQAGADEGVTTGLERPPGRMLISRSAAAHLLALAPLAFTLGIASVQIFAVAYRELVNPTNASPIVLRVVGGALGPVAAIIVAWVLGELVGGAAVRRIVLGGESVVGSVVRSVRDLVRRPGSAIIAPLVPLAILVIDLVTVLAVVSLVWSEVRDRLVRPLDEPIATALALASLGAAWCLALLVTGLIDAWRSVALTFEMDRSAAGGTAPWANAAESGGSGSPAGTIGASTPGRPGDWSAGDGGGSL